jgi:hypothetical protein
VRAHKALTTSPDLVVDRLEEPSLLAAYARPHPAASRRGASSGSRCKLPLIVAASSVVCDACGPTPQRPEHLSRDNENGPQAVPAVQPRLLDSRSVRAILRLCNGNAEARGLRRHLDRFGQPHQFQIVTLKRDMTGRSVLYELCPLAVNIRWALGCEAVACMRLAASTCKSK